MRNSREVDVLRILLHVHRVLEHFHVGIHHGLEVLFRSGGFEGEHLGLERIRE